MLKTASNGISIYYDPIGRISEYDTTVSTRFINDGAEIAAEIDNPADYGDSALISLR